MASKFFFILVSTLLLMSCSKDEDKTKDLLQGKWRATSISEDGIEYISNQTGYETSATLEFLNDKASFKFSANNPNFPLEEETYQGTFNSDGKKIDMVLVNADLDTIKWNLNVLVLESKRLEVAGTLKSNEPSEPISQFSAKFVK